MSDFEREFKDAVGAATKAVFAVQTKLDTAWKEYKQAQSAAVAIKMTNDKLKADSARISAEIAELRASFDKKRQEDLADVYQKKMQAEQLMQEAKRKEQEADLHLNEAKVKEKAASERLLALTKKEQAHQAKVEKWSSFISEVR